MGVWRVWDGRVARLGWACGAFGMGVWCVWVGLGPASRIWAVNRQPSSLRPEMLSAVRRPKMAELLDLEPHPEGGWFRQTWRSSLTITPDGYDGKRAAGTAIYYLLEPGEHSRWHSVRSDELWLWHGGGPLTLRLAAVGTRPTEPYERVIIGPDVGAGHHPQFVVPASVWQSAEPASARPVLVTCVVIPGFYYADFRLAAPTGS
jgi:predicted cupin superfamily sugar epimerase